MHPYLIHLAAVAQRDDDRRRAAQRRLVVGARGQREGRWWRSTMRRKVTPRASSIVDLPELEALPESSHTCDEFLVQGVNRS